MNRNPLLAHHSNFSKFFLFIGIALLSLGLFSILSIVLAKYYFHIPLSTIGNLKTTNDANAINVLKMMQLMQAIGLFILPPILFALIDSAQPLHYLKLNKKPLIYSAFCCVLLMLCSQPLINWMAEINSLMPAPEWMRVAEKEAEKVTELFLQMNGWQVLLTNLVLIAFLPALGEELLFRGVIQRLFQNSWHNHHLAIWLSAILFSALHMQFLGFFPRMFMGAAFGYLLHWSGNLWLPIIAHFINNAGAVIISYMIQKKGLDKEIETVGTNSGHQLYVVISALLVGVVLFLIYKNEKNAQATAKETLIT